MKTLQAYILATITFITGVLIGIAVTYHQPKVITKTAVKKVYVQESNIDVSTKACIANHGVPTFSAWDGGLNGCIEVGQSSRDTSKP